LKPVRGVVVKPFSNIFNAASPPSVAGHFHDTLNFHASSVLLLTSSSETQV
jgi:hypothetical protein